MKQLLFPAFAVLALGAGSASATEYAHVISSTPVTEEVSTPQKICRDEQLEVQTPRDATGSVIGAVAGGLLGSTMGRGGGKAAATAAGVIAGAVAGDAVANSKSGSQMQTVRRCETRYVRSRQVTGYDVVYEYAGRRYSTRLADDPGSQMPITVSPAGTVVGDDDSRIEVSEAPGPDVVVVQHRPVTVVPMPFPYVYPDYPPRRGPHWR